MYIYHLAGDTPVLEYRVSATNPSVVGARARRSILAIDQPAQYSNHKGGWMAFGLDGKRFIATGDGDGGGSGDPPGAGQTKEPLPGKLLRIDVNSDGFPADATRNYAIPSDNPFVGSAGLDEICALGLRNPRRNGFDRATGGLYIADVGQGAHEEINLGASGANYGWNLYEGTAPYAGGSTSGLTFPIHEYPHTLGRSVTGGYVYRGPNEAQHGQYIFGDFATSKLFTLDDATGAWAATDGTAQLAPSAGTVASIDPATYCGASAGVTVDLASGLGKRGEATGDRLNGVENLHGSAYADVLVGDAPASRFEAGAGADTLTGNAGADTFVWGHPWEGSRLVASADRITDLAPGSDRIDVCAIDAAPVLAGNQAFAWIGIAAFGATFPQARYTVAGGETVVEFDTGDGAADLVIRLTGTLTLSATDVAL